MEKAKINNEIILMRKNVGQARVHVIKRLTREARKLRLKKGTEAQKAKNLRKARRLVREIVAAKKLKKDEVTKFALRNTKALKDILNDQSNKTYARITARISYDKSFQARLADFRTKYPDYINFLGPGRKALAKLERKAKANLENDPNAPQPDKDQRLAVEQRPSQPSRNKDDDPLEEPASPNQCPTDDAEGEGDQDHDHDQEHQSASEVDSESEDVDENDDPEMGSESESMDGKEAGTGSESEGVDGNGGAEMASESEGVDQEEDGMECKEENVAEKLDVSVKEAGDKGPSAKKAKRRKKDNGAKRKKTEAVKVISKEAIVTKLENVLQDDTSDREMMVDEGHLDERLESNGEHVKEENVKIKKQVDSFFVMGDGRTDYLSIADTRNDGESAESKSNRNDNLNSFDNTRYQRHNDDSFNDKSRSNDSRFQERNDNNFHNRFRKDNNNYRFQANADCKFNDKFRNNDDSKFQRKGADQRHGFANNRYGKDDSRFNSDGRSAGNWQSRQRDAARPRDDRGTWNRKDSRRSNNDDYKDKRSRSFNKNSRSGFEGGGGTTELHPSWEAKRKQQELLKKGFQGKKIVFDDV